MPVSESLLTQRNLKIPSDQLVDQAMAQRNFSPANTIPLATVIDFIVQKTYHDLTVLAELLPRKTDMEKKIEIVRFASRTRQMFIRLLALVKWAKNAGNVDKCWEISAFLDHQALLFVDTADALARMSRENLATARLPMFSIPHAVDVLTTGSYSRLPTCIKEKIVPPDPITTSEKNEVLLRLNQIIQHRLITSDLPPQMSNLQIADGKVKFHVPCEFDVTLTLMGDDPSIPWRLLSIDILVQDPEPGSGKSLVHSLQVNYIHQLVQSRLFGDEKPLLDLYNCLHSFCLSLQLEVLRTDADRLIRECWGELIQIDKYVDGLCLTVSYWRTQVMSGGSSQQRESYTLSVQVDCQDQSKPLQVLHQPPFDHTDAQKTNQIVNCGHLSLEKLLVQAINLRTEAKLKEFQQALKRHQPNIKSQLEGHPAVLVVSVLDPCLKSESLFISVDPQMGIYQASMQSADRALQRELEECLNTAATNLAKLPDILMKFRYFLGMKRCTGSVSLLPAVEVEKPPLTPVGPSHPLSLLKPYKLFFKLTKHQGFFVVVELSTSVEKSELSYKYHLMQTRPTNYPETPTSLVSIEGDPSEQYLAITGLTPINPHTAAFDLGEPEDYEMVETGKRRVNGQSSWTAVRKSKWSDTCPHYQCELAYVIATCDARVPYVQLCTELRTHDILHQGIQEDASGVGLVLKLISLPMPEGCSPKVHSSLSKSLLESTFRIQGQDQLRIRTGKIWLASLIFADCPLNSTNQKEQGEVSHVYLNYDQATSEDSYPQTVARFLHDWKAICKLYALVLDLASALQDPSHPFSSAIEVRSYTYKKLVIGYGKDKANTVSIQFQSTEGLFQLSFGAVGPQVSSPNSHSLTAPQLQHHLNHHQNILLFVQILLDTHNPLDSICKLPSYPLYRTTGPKKNFSSTIMNFTCVPQSPTHFRISFRNIYCLDIHCKGKNLVTVRDGAYSLYDVSKVVEGFSPAPGLKSFLDLYVDESVGGSRQRPMGEDDNPPSPTGLMQPIVATGSPRVNPAMSGAMTFTPYSIMSPSTSNPTTPASPHIPPAYTTLASPPSIPTNITPSPGMMGGSPMPAPSPKRMIEGSGGGSMGSPYTSVGGPGSSKWPSSPSMQGLSPATRLGAATSPGNPSTPLGSSGAAQQPHTALHGPPSRVLPQRSWAASVPTLLSHQGLDMLLAPTSPPGGSPGGQHSSPLARFFGSVMMKRHLQRLIQADENLQVVASGEPGVIQFRVESLLCKVGLSPASMQSLHLKATPSPEYRDVWNPEELQILEKFFETKVACFPYKLNAMSAFSKLMGIPTRALKDCVHIMKLELFPDRSMKWGVTWCLTVPPSASIMAEPGMAGIAVKNKMIFFLQLTRMGMPLAGMGGGEPQVLVVPIVHEFQSNATSQSDIPAMRGQPPNSPYMLVNAIFRRWSEYNPPKHGECTIFGAVRELLTNLLIPA